MLTRLPHGEFFGRTGPEAHAHGFRLAHHEPSPAAIGLHAHDTAHFILVQSGRYVSEAAGAGNSGGQPLLIYNPPGTTHRDHFQADEGRYRGRFFSIAVHASRMTEMTEVVPLTSDARRIAEPRAVALARRLADQCRHWDTTSPLVAEGLSLELMAFAAARCRPERGAPPAWLIRAREALRDQENREMSIAMVAEQIGVHPVHLARAFRRHFGCTPGDYLRHCRLERGARMLETSPRPLSEIAYAAGFGDQSHFTRAFKRAYATTPGAYRRTRRMPVAS